MHQPPDINLETSTAFVEAFYSAVQLVVEYMRKSNDMILGVLSKDDDTKIRDHALQGLWLRAFAWMQSLETLNHTKHFQAIASGNRALLEITVDLILLHSDKSNESASKMHWWAQSEKLKAATIIVNFLRRLMRQFLINSRLKRRFTILKGQVLKWSGNSCGELMIIRGDGSEIEIYRETSKSLTACSGQQ
jgi:hypothetical protein